MLTIEKNINHKFVNMKKNEKSLRDFINKSLILNELPQLKFGNPNVTIGKKYPIIDVEGSNFWLIDDDGLKTSFHSGRFNLDIVL